VEKRNSKKGGYALLGRPASLSAQPSHAARPPLPSLPRTDARLAPPGAPMRHSAPPLHSLFFLPIRAAAVAAAELHRAPLAPQPSSQLRSPALDETQPQLRLDKRYLVRTLSAVRIKVLGEILSPRHGQSSGELSVRADLPSPTFFLFVRWRVLVAALPQTLSAPPFALYRPETAGRW